MESWGEPMESSPCFCSTETRLSVEAQSPYSSRRTTTSLFSSIRPESPKTPDPIEGRRCLHEDSGRNVDGFGRVKSVSRSCHPSAKSVPLSHAICAGGGTSLPSKSSCAPVLGFGLKSASLWRPSRRIQGGAGEGPPCNTSRPFGVAVRLRLRRAVASRLRVGQITEAVMRSAQSYAK